MIGGQHDEGVVVDALGLQLLHQITDQRVDVGGLQQVALPARARPAPSSIVRRVLLGMPPISGSGRRVDGPDGRYW